MIGHESILGDLKRIAADGSLAHGYIFFGEAMVGKAAAARALAEHLEGGSVLSDYAEIEPGENNSIGIDAAREIKHFLWQKPNVSARRTLVIKDADLATTEAQNALLKVTEEPPASSLLILVTSNIDGIMPTILSRLQHIYFGAVPEKEIAAWLASEHAVPKAKAVETAKRSFGKPGLAWRLLHDEAFQGQLEFAEKFIKTSAATRRDLIKKIIEPETFNFRKFLDAVIIVLAWEAAAAGNAAKTALWHKALALYDRETNFSLNPRLQLEALLGAQSNDRPIR